MAILATTLLAFWFCGCVGVLVDLDHVIAHKRNLDHRFLHPIFMLVACVVIFCCIAHLGGLVIGLVLK